MIMFPSSSLVLNPLQVDMYSERQLRTGIDEVLTIVLSLTHFPRVFCLFRSFHIQFEAAHETEALLKRM